MCDLRVQLRRAGITRADIDTGDTTRKPLGFQDLRATGLTWLAVRGDDPLKIMQRAGHRDFKTTQLYVREAEAITAKVRHGVSGATAGSVWGVG